MKREQHLQMPPELMRCLSEYMNPADVLAATLVTTDTVRETARPLDVWISYVARTRSWSAHRAGLPDLTASSLPELRARLEEVCGGAAVRLHLSRGARAEVARRNGGTPRAVGWT